MFSLSVPNLKFTAPKLFAANHIMCHGVDQFNIMIKGIFTKKNDFWKNIKFG